MAEYTNRFVGYLDIIGFKNHINRTTGENPELTVNKIIIALNAPGPIEPGQIILGDSGDIAEADHKMTTFSDNVLISTESSEKGPLNLLAHIEKISYRLLKLGFLSRGGIARGETYQDDLFVFGPAINDAVNLEKDHAYYPRTILSQEVCDFGKNLTGNSLRMFKSFTKNASDNYYFVHTLRIPRMISDCCINNNEPINEKVSAKWDWIINKLISDREHQQISWFLDYFNWAIDTQFPVNRPASVFR